MSKSPAISNSIFSSNLSAGFRNRLFAIPRLGLGALLTCADRLHSFLSGLTRFNPLSWPHAVARQCPARAGSRGLPVWDMTSVLDGAVYRWVATSRTGTKGTSSIARTSTATSTEPTMPAFQAWHVTNKGDDSFWIKVGAAWPHRDGKGLSLILSVIPMNGQMVLRQPLSKQ
jgi:hypothetical protein